MKRPDCALSSRELSLPPFHLLLHRSEPLLILSLKIAIITRFSFSPSETLHLQLLSLLPGSDLALQLLSLLLLRQLLLLVLSLHLLHLGNMYSFKNIPSPVWSDSVQNQLFYLNGVWLSPAHVELVVAHAEGEDPLVDPQSGGKEHKVGCFFVNWLWKCKFRDIS